MSPAIVVIKILTSMIEEHDLLLLVESIGIFLKLLDDIPFVETSTHLRRASRSKQVIQKSSAGWLEGKGFFLFIKGI